MLENPSYHLGTSSSMHQMYGSMPPNLMQGYFGNMLPLTKIKSHSLEMLKLLDLTHLTNDLVHHQLGWLVI